MGREKQMAVHAVAVVCNNSEAVRVGKVQPTWRNVLAYSAHGCIAPESVAGGAGTRARPCILLFMLHSFLARACMYVLVTGGEVER
jgi:hypothetical protein